MKLPDTSPPAKQKLVVAGLALTCLFWHTVDAADETEIPATEHSVIAALANTTLLADRHLLP